MKGGVPMMSGVPMMMEPSPWIAKAIGRLNKSGVLKAQISYSDAIGGLSAMPESAAIGLIKELEGKAEDVNEPTGWLITAAAKYRRNGANWKTSNELSKKVGRLNKAGVLAEPVSWSDVAGPLMCMDESNAMELIDEL